MNNSQIISFLINQGILKETEYIAGKVNIERYKGRHWIFIISIENDKKKFLKTYINLSEIDGKGIEREYILTKYHYQKLGKTDIYQNSTVITRDFIPDYSLFNGSNITNWMIGLGIELQEFHNKPKHKLIYYSKKFGIKYKTENIFPITIPASKTRIELKFCSPTEKEFWNIIEQNRQKFDEYLKKFKDKWSYNTVLHGDFRIDNVIRKKNNNENKFLFVDFEQWFYGDKRYDIITFFFDLKLKGIKYDSTNFLEEYFGKPIANFQNDVNFIKTGIRLLMIQDVYRNLDTVRFPEAMKAHLIKQFE